MEDRGPVNFNSGYPIIKWVAVTWQTRQDARIVVPHYSDVIMSAMASQITGVSIIGLIGFFSGADQRKYQSSASLAFVRGIHRWLVFLHYKGPVTRKMFPLDDVIMNNDHLATSPVKKHQHMMTSSNGNIFRVTGPLCGEFTGPGEFPTQGPMTRSFDVFFDLRLNKRLSKQPWCWWFETPSWSLWRHCNDVLSPVRLDMAWHG